MKKIFLFAILTASFCLISRQVTYEVVCKNGTCQSTIGNIINNTSGGMSCQMNNEGIIEACFKDILLPFWGAKYQGNH